jgi:hypothetical protein
MTKKILQKKLEPLLRECGAIKVGGLTDKRLKTLDLPVQRKGIYGIFEQLTINDDENIAKKARRYNSLVNYLKTGVESDGIDFPSGIDGQFESAFLLKEAGLLTHDNALVGKQYLKRNSCQGNYFDARYYSVIVLLEKPKVPPLKKVTESSL